MASLRRVVRFLAFSCLALLLLFEEWGWEPLAAWLGRLARLPLWARLERRIAALPPTAALLVFAVPMLGLAPVKVLALYLFGSGHASWGVALLVAAKLLGTALLARLFHLTRPAMMQLPWFARWYPRWKDWKDALLALVRQSQPWQGAVRLKARVQAVVREWLAERR